MAANSNDNSEGRLDSTRAFFLREERSAESRFDEEQNNLPRSHGRESGEEFFLQNIHRGDSADAQSPLAPAAASNADAHTQGAGVLDAGSQPVEAPADSPRAEAPTDTGAEAPSAVDPSAPPQAPLEPNAHETSDFNAFGEAPSLATDGFAPTPEALVPSPAGEDADQVAIEPPPGQPPVEAPLPDSHEAEASASSTDAEREGAAVDNVHTESSAESAASASATPAPAEVSSSSQVPSPPTPGFDANGATSQPQAFVDNSDQLTLGSTPQPAADSADAQSPLAPAAASNADAHTQGAGVLDAGSQPVEAPADSPRAEAPTENIAASSPIKDNQNDRGRPQHEFESQPGKGGASRSNERGESKDAADEIADSVGRAPKGSVGVDIRDHDDTTNRISGTSDDDRIFGSNDADVIEGGQGNDAIFGRGGDDVFVVSGTENGENDFHGGKGTDRIVGSAGDDRIGLSKFNAGHSVEEIDAGDGHDVVHGTSRHDHLDFSGTELSGVEEIRGNDGDDRIVGSHGDDTILGGAGDDVIDGNRGNDTLEGGAGNDVVSGGAGDDIFIFSAYDGQDTYHGGGGWTDAIELNTDAYSGTEFADNPWTISVDGEELGADAIAAADGALALNPDSAGVITMADGSELMFDGVEEIRW